MYVTIDLDYPTRLEIVTAWKRLESFGDVEGRLSKSGNGVHLRTTDVPIYPVPIRERQRRIALDDRNRIEADNRSDLNHNQVLWDSPYEWTKSVDRLASQYKRKQPLNRRHKI